MFTHAFWKVKCNQRKKKKLGFKTFFFVVVVVFLWQDNMEDFCAFFLWCDLMRQLVVPHAGTTAGNGHVMFLESTTQASNLCLSAIGRLPFN